MPLWFNKALNLTEGEIRAAMANSTTATEAARFLGCHKNTYIRYAKRYIDSDTQLTLHELHLKSNKKNKIPTRTLVRNPNFKYNTDNDWRVTAKLPDILAGKYPAYDKKKLARRLIDELILPECCSQCKFDERRVTDFQVPLVLIWEDGDTTNHLLENLKFLCYNCYFLTYANVSKSSFGANFKGFIL